VEIVYQQQRYPGARKPGQVKGTSPRFGGFKGYRTAVVTQKKGSFEARLCSYTRAKKAQGRGPRSRVAYYQGDELLCRRVAEHFILYGEIPSTRQLRA
jgi:hypothetical protein